MTGGIDPELLRQLAEALKSGQPVAAVLRLASRQGVKPEPESIETQAREAIQRVSASTGQAPDDVHVMGRIGVVYVTGPALFIQELVDQPEVRGAVANKQPGD